MANIILRELGESLESRYQAQAAQLVHPHKRSVAAVKVVDASSTQMTFRSSVSGWARHRTMKAKHRMSKSGVTHALTSLMCIVLVAYFYYSTRTLGNTMKQATILEKMMLVDNVLAGRVFETNVNKLPVLSELFKEYEKLQKYFIPGLNMTDYDESCNDMYRDSMSGDFDKDFYEWKEYEYKMIHLNKTEDKIWNCERRTVIEPYGCCTACREVENCCACKNDGRKDIMKEVILPNKDVPFAINSPITRGFGFEQTDERYDLEDLYQAALRKLGYQGTEKAAHNYAHCKALSYIPPGGFFLWHTNRYDNNVVPYRLYIISVDRDGESAFKYQLPNGENHDVMDFHGAVRIFKNTFDDLTTGEEKYLWHSVYSNAHRNSLGFEIRAPEIVALLDTCGTSCWDDLKKQYEEIYGVPYDRLNQ